MMMGTDLSSRMLSLPQYEGGDEWLLVLEAGTGWKDLRGWWHHLTDKFRGGGCGTVLMSLERMLPSSPPPAAVFAARPCTTRTSLSMRCQGWTLAGITQSTTSRHLVESCHPGACSGNRKHDELVVGCLGHLAFVIDFQLQLANVHALAYAPSRSRKQPAEATFGGTFLLHLICKGFGTLC